LINFNTSIQQINNLITKIIPDISSTLHIKLHHPNHNLDVGIKIAINDNEYIITKIIDDNWYEIYNDFLMDTYFNETIICITYPDIFQLCFNFPDTIGNILCFDRIGEKDTVTDYAHIVKNNNYHGKKLICNSKYKSDYFYITCPELNTGIEYYRNTAPVTDVFAQIRWIYDEYNNTSIDSFVPTAKIFDPPIDILTQLQIQIVHPDGKLVDLNGADHSFTIEITEVYNQPTNTDISARINSQIFPCGI
jgi:hypothetical protein